MRFTYKITISSSNNKNRILKINRKNWHPIDNKIDILQVKKYFTKLLFFKFIKNIYYISFNRTWK